MILTPIDGKQLPHILDLFEEALSGDRFAVTAFLRIRASAGPRGLEPGTAEELEAWRADAVRLAGRFGIPTLDEDPAVAFSWDGHAIRTRSEPSVVIHEIAHWQLCPPGRRHLFDFGLGAGPETGRRAEADAVLAASMEQRQDEECLTSLLGILWEVELGQPGLLAFVEQNWLEGYQRPAAAEHFRHSLYRLRNAGFLDASGRPSFHSRISAEPI